MKLNGFALLLCFLLVVACGGCKQPPMASIKESVKDSTHVSVREREEPFIIAGETVTVTKYIECDSVTNKPKETTIETRGKSAFTKTTIDKDGKLTSTGGCDSLRGVLHAKDSIIQHFRETKKETVQPVIIYKTRIIDWWTRVIAAAALVYILLKIKTIFFNIKKLFL